MNGTCQKGPCCVNWGVAYLPLHVFVFAFLSFLFYLTSTRESSSIERGQCNQLPVEKIVFVIVIVFVFVFVFVFFFIFVIVFIFIFSWRAPALKEVNATNCRWKQRGALRWRQLGGAQHNT